MIMAKLSYSDVVFSFGFRRWGDADPYASAPAFSPHRIARLLVDDSDVPKVVVADAYRSRLASFKGRSAGSEGEFPRSSTRLLRSPKRWRRFDGDGRRMTAVAYRRLDRDLAHTAARQGMHRPVLVTCHPVHAAIADRKYWSEVVYYAWDDWLAYPVMASRRRTTAWAYRRLAERDTSVIAVSQPILDRLGARRGVVVPNGIDAAAFDRLPEVPGWYAELTRPVAFYAGALESRVDVEGLVAAAADLPDWTFVLVGPVREPERLAPLSGKPNVVLRAAVSQAEVLAMAQRATVCLVPHRRTEMSVSMSPLKLYEYVGSGTPVVAADLPPMRGVSDRVTLVEPGSEYTPAILHAAKLPPIADGDLREWRAQNDWTQRYGEFRKAMFGVDDRDRPLLPGNGL